MSITHKLTLSKDLSTFFRKAQEMVGTSTMDKNPDQDRFLWEWDEEKGYTRIELKEYGIVLDQTMTTDYHVVEMNAVLSGTTEKNFEKDLKDKLSQFMDRYCFNMSVPEIKIA